MFVIVVQFSAHEPRIALNKRQKKEIFFELGKKIHYLFFGKTCTAFA